jgi:hypothetical protein
MKHHLATLEHIQDPSWAIPFDEPVVLLRANQFALVKAAAQQAEAEGDTELSTQLYDQADLMEGYPEALAARLEKEAADRVAAAELLKKDIRPADDEEGN